MIAFPCPKCQFPVLASPDHADRVACPACRGLVAVPPAGGVYGPHARLVRLALNMVRAAVWGACGLWTGYWLLRLFALQAALANQPGHEAAAGVAAIGGSVAACAPIVGGYVVCRAADALLLIARGD